MKKYTLKKYKYHCPIIVQGRNKEEAKHHIEERLKAILLHPDGIRLEHVEEVQ